MGETSTEQRALIGFAARLGTSVSHEDGISNEGYLRSEAELLMNLLVSNPTAVAVDESLWEEPLDSVRPYFDEEPSCEVQQPPSERRNSGEFSFSCPSLSLDGKSMPHSQERTSSDSSLDSVPSLVAPAPIISMGRPLVVEDRDALRLSCEAMARNILRTYEKAVQWRKQCWIDTLARPLVDEERQMKEAGATEQKLKELLETPAAMVIASLNQSTIEVLEARTSFRVLPQQWDQGEGKVLSGEEPPLKRLKVDPNDAPTKYKAAYVLSFQTVLNLNSPAGYSEINLEAPGIIEGTFTTSSDGEPSLVGVAVHVDTRVLTAMIEKSSRIIARASAEMFMEPPPEPTEAEEASVEASFPLMSECESPPQREQTLDTEDINEGPTIVTPRVKSPPNGYFDSVAALPAKTCMPLPEDLDDKNQRPSLRMVSPQPGSMLAAGCIYPRPSINDAPSLVSPTYTNSDRTSRIEYLSFESRTGPSLPALVEVACAAMHKN